MRSRFHTAGPSGGTGLGALLGALVLVALSAVLGAAPAEASSHRVTMAKYAYGPSSLSITQGDTVTWTNQDTAPHDVVVTSGPQSFRSPLLEQGESWTFTFRAAGTYSYTCSVHPDMRASVTVAAAPKATEPSPRGATHPVTSAPAPATGGAASRSASATDVHSSGFGTDRKVRRGVADSGSTTATTPGQAATVSDTTLNPLLLVAGAAIAVVVYCLLLLASRPAVPARAGPDEPGQG